MILLLISFLAGVLTVLAPCVLPVLPIIIGGSIQGGKRDTLRPIIITASLAISIVVFTLILKFSTAFIDIPRTTWAFISGSILILLGLTMMLPRAWDTISNTLKISNGSKQILADQNKKQASHTRDILIGAALGPVFSSCSPTYLFILATILPQSFGTGFIYLVAYALGLSSMLLLIGYLGQTVIKKVRWAANPSGWFKKTLGVLFVLVGLFIITGFDKQLQSFLLDHNYLDLSGFEQQFLDAQ